MTQILDWNRLAITLIKYTSNHIRGDTGDVARTMCLLNASMFNAVNGAQSGGASFEPVIVDNAVDEPAAPAHASAEAAAIGAGHLVLQDLFDPPLRSQIRNSNPSADIDQQLADSVGALTDPADAIQAGLAWGRAQAGRVLAARRHDVPAPDGTINTAPGRFARSWRSQYARMQPLVMAQRDQFRAPPPPASNGFEYAKAWLQVYKLGHRNSPMRDEEQTAIAHFWNGGAGTSRPSGAWFEAAIDIAEQQGFDLERSARLFCLLGLAIGDAMLSSWDTKATYDLWRPARAIRNAHEDGNTSTERDVNWIQLSGSEGGSPEYTSGTATFAASASTILRAFVGETIEFTLDLQRDIDIPDPVPARTYQSLSDAAEEAGMSRIYNGIHFSFANTAGMEAGAQIAELVLATHPPETDGSNKSSGGKAAKNKRSKKARRRRGR